MCHTTTWDGRHHRCPLRGSHPPPLQQVWLGGEDVTEGGLAHIGFRFLETQLLCNVISLLHTLWVTNLGDKGEEVGEQPPCTLGSQEPPKLLALHMVNEFLYVLLALTKHLR